MDAPILKTHRLLIKRLERYDAVAMFAYRADPRVAKYQTWYPKTLEEVQQFIEKYSRCDFAIPGTWFQLGVYLQRSKHLIGDIGLHFLEENTNTVEIGYTIAPDHQRKGFAFEALGCVIKFLADRIDIEKIFAVVMRNNKASTALISKLGACETDPSEYSDFTDIQNDDRLFVIPVET